jgi:hypothetical protein
MKNTKVWDPIGRPSRLKQLGLTEGVLLLAVEEGQAAWANCTMNHPPLYRGIVAWGEPIRSLRESLIPLGWVRYDECNLPLILNKEGTLAITVATGDEDTGCEDRNPCTKSSKGPYTQSAITNNALAHTLFGDIRKVTARTTWILLFHRDEQTSETRCELSLPFNMNDEGQVDEWLERIILGPIPFGGASVRASSEPPRTPDIEIDVKRRHSA